MPVDDHYESFAAKIEDKTVGVGIVGLGYVGLPLALAFVRAGVSVLGFEVDQSKVNLLAEGRSYLKHIPAEEVHAAMATGLLGATTDFSRVNEVDAILIAVPTPLTAQREPDMSYVLGTVDAIAAALKPGQLVVLESTTYPGTTEEVVRPALEKSGIRVGAGLFLAFSPEREDPGNRSYGTSTIPKVVGGVDEQSCVLATRLYELAVESCVPVSSSRTAEAVKLTENIFRAVNIALVNELKVVYARMGIDIWEVLDAAATKPFGFMKFSPGPGLGGHCIPIDPFYLTWKAREYGLSTRFIELAGEINVSMPQYVIDNLQLALNKQRKAVNGAKVLILGVAYKKDVDDSRESPAFVLISLLKNLGAHVSYHDPFVPSLPRTRAWQHLLPMRSVTLSAPELALYDAVVVATDHTMVDYDLVRQSAALVVDTRGVYRGEFENVVKA